MKAEARTKNLMTLLGWQGGTVHDSCKEIGCEAHDFLYTSADFDDNGPCADFRRELWGLPVPEIIRTGPNG